MKGYFVMTNKSTSSWVYGLYRLGPIILVLSFPLFFRGEYVLGLVQTICYYSMAVIGLNILIGYTGQISLGQSGFMAVGAYTSALLATKWGWPLWVTFPFSALTSALVGFLIALPVIRTRGLYLAMMTLAFGFVVEILTQRWIDLTGGTMGIYGVPTPTLFGREVGPLGYFYLVAVTWAILQWIADNLVESRWGKMLAALMHSEEAAKSVGISVNRQKVLAFVVSAAYTGIAGFFLAHQTGYLNSDSFTIHTSIFFLVALLIGGSGSRWGPLVGATVLTLINQVLAGLYEYRFFLYGGTIIAVLVLLPDGIMGVMEKKIRSFLRDRAEPLTEGNWKEAKDIGTLLAIQDQRSSDEGILKIRKLLRAFGGLIAVNDVDLTVRRGQIHAIIGPNGAGKSTLINLITGNLEAQHGSIIFEGLQLNGLSPDRRGKLGIARTFQNLQLFDGLSVLDNVVLGFYRHFETGPVAYALSLPSSYREERDFKRRALTLLRFLGIDRLANVTVNDLSYGHQKLVEIARALALRPNLLLLDEAVAGLNRSEIKEVSGLLEQLRHAGMTILLIEHNIDFIMRASDRVSVFNFGIKIAEGSPQEVQDDPGVIEAYIGRGDGVHTLEKVRQKQHRSPAMTHSPTPDEEKYRDDAPLLSVNGLSVRYDKAEVLREMDFEVRQNELVCLIGANGAGKTTFVRAISGLAPIVKGQAAFEGVALKGVEPYQIARLGIAHVPQGRQVIPDLTVMGNLELGSYRFHGKDRRKVSQLIEEVFERFPILHRRQTQLAGSLSGGEQQLLAISRALMMAPKFIMMDEPSLGLAPLVVEEIMEAALGLAEIGITVLLVEQAATLALAISDKAYVLQNGEIIMKGTGHELYKNPDIIKGYLGG